MGEGTSIPRVHALPLVRVRAYLVDEEPASLIDAGHAGSSGRIGRALTVHGRGLGDDGPLITNQSKPDVVDTEIPPNTVFVVKPSTTYNGLSNVGHVGDTVVVTATGCERLGTRPIDHYWHV